MAQRLPAVVIDNGTGYTKMGFAGNTEPSYIMPTVICTNEQTSGRAATNVKAATSVAKKGVEDLDFFYW